MKPVEYVDQSASGLALNVIEGAIDIQRFTVFRTGRIGGRDLTVRAAIIGASHVLSFETGGAVLTEIFACTDARGGSNRILFGPLGDLLKAATELTFADGRRYRFNASLVTSAARERFHGRTAGRAQRLRLAFRFPRRPDRKASPETIVEVTRIRNQVFADTAHCYPDEDKVVVTSSELTWGRLG